MKKTLFIVFLMAMATCHYGYSNDSLKIVYLQREVANLKSSISKLQQEDGNLKDLYQQQAKELDSLRTLQLHQVEKVKSLADKVGADISDVNHKIDNNVSTLFENIKQQAKELDSLRANLQQQTENVKSLADKVGAEISDANQKIDDNVSTLSESISSRTRFGAIGILIAIGLLACTYYILRKKISSGATTIDKIRSAQEGLETAQKAMQEESVKLDSKLVELLDRQLTQPQGNVEEDHKLVLSIATEVVRIEQNLAFMDPKTKGVSNLKNRALAIKTTLQSRGYEIPTLIGEIYHEGDNMKPTMELDEELPAGTHIIRRVMKPMVLFKGKLIQAAEVVVAYNE